MQWHESDKGLQRSLEFSNQTELAEFVLQLAKVSDAMGHHADMQISYNCLNLTVITHDQRRITEKDWQLCSEIDALCT